MPDIATAYHKLQTGKSAGKDASLPEFIALEEKLLHPTGANERFDLLVDRMRRVPEEEKIFFTQNLGVMITSGLSASRALQTLALQARSLKFKRALLRVARFVEKGGSLSDALEQHPQIFTPIFVGMIRAGEAAGQLEDVLKELTNQLKRSHELKNKVKGALIYPMVILVAMVGIGTFMLVFVVPKLLDIFREMDVALPLATRALIAVSDFIQAYALVVVPLVVGVGALLGYAARRGAGQRLWHLLIIRLPVLKTIAGKINLAQFSRTLGSLLKTDMPIVQCLQLTGNVLKNVHYRASLHRAAERVEKGQKLSEQLSSYPLLYPPVAVQMVAVGEETGELSNILKQMADFYEEDVNQTMNSLPSLIEPVLILLLGGAVGGMAVAVIMPMFSLTEAL